MKKNCKTCGLPVIGNEDSFSINQRYTKKDGTPTICYCSYCKRCHFTQNKFYREKRGPHQRNTAPYCYDCKLQKEGNKDKFHKASRNKDGLNEICKKCKSERRKEYNKRPDVAEKAREWSYLNKYNMTIAQFDQLLEDQGKQCAICKTKTPGGSKGRFCIDHCHETGIVRGLLCVNCNQMLGHSKDSIETLRKAAVYLESM